MKWKKNIYFYFIFSAVTTTVGYSATLLRQTIFRPLSFIPMEVAFTREVTGCWKAPLAQLLPESVKRSGSVVFGSQLRICVWALARGVRGEKCGPKFALQSPLDSEQMSGTKSACLPFHNWFPRQSNGFLNCSTERGRPITVSPNTPRIHQG